MRRSIWMISLLASVFAVLSPRIYAGNLKRSDALWIAEPAYSLGSAQWIWHAADGVTPPACTRYFRDTFVVPANRGAVAHAYVLCAADNGFTLYVNGVEAGRGNTWSSPGLMDVTSLIQSGSNVLAVLADKRSRSGRAHCEVGC